MTTQEAASSPRSLARIGGFLYLVIILGGLFAPFAVAPTGMMLGESALPTVATILSSKPRYVLGGVAQLFVYSCDVGVALILYELLRPVCRSVALAAALFRLVFVAVAAANMINHFAPLIFLSGANYLGAFNSEQLQSLAISFLRLRTFGFDVALVFFGLHWILAGYLIFKSTFFPRILGIVLAIGGVGYLLNIAATAVPRAYALHLFPYVMLPAGLAEIALTLWLIIKGVDIGRWKQVNKG
jgi:hypothetical protein